MIQVSQKGTGERMSRLDNVEKLASVTPIEGKKATYEVARDAFVETVRQLRDDADLAFTGLLDLTCVENEEEMRGVYFFMNLDDFEMITLEVPFSKDELHMPSLCDLFSAANALERETYDFFGIQYEGHPNLKRILLADDFVGYPLRKDYVSHTRD